MSITRVVSRCTAVVLFGLTCVAFAPARAQQPNAGAFVQGELIIQFRPGVGPAQRAAVRAAHNATVLREYATLRMERVSIPAAANALAVAQAFSARPEIEAAQPNFIREAVSTASPNDPYYVSGDMWGLTKIAAPAAWSAFGGGSDTVVVADIDTGVNYAHPDLAAHMWTNPGEIPGNAVDDDQNGYVDDVYGIDTVNNDSDPADDHGHGTHTSGTFGAVSDNGIGVAGVSPNVRILACKFISSRNTGSDADAIECFNYVVGLTQRGVNIRVTSNSWGGERDAFFPTALKNAIDAAGNAGIVNVFAAGNAGKNIDVTAFDPASFTSPSIVSVAASDSGDNRAGWSNYGATSVDLAAPGVDTLSAYGNGYAYMSGTSMATPHVAGVAALLLAHSPWLTVDEVKSSLLGGVDKLDQWNGVVAAGGRLNAYQTLTAVPAVDPPDDPIDPPVDPTPVNDVPVVTFVTPVDGSAVVAGATLTLRATADDADGITQVVFSVGNTDIPAVLGADGRTATAQWTAAGTAWQQISMRAADPEGALGTASIRVRIKRK